MQDWYELRELPPKEVIPMMGSSLFSIFHEMQGKRLDRGRKDAETRRCWGLKRLSLDTFANSPGSNLKKMKLQGKWLRVDFRERS
jgi:hypothetical protein